MTYRVIIPWTLKYAGAYAVSSIDPYATLEET